MDRQTSNEAGLDARVPERWLPAVRAIWLLTVFGLLILFIVAIGPFFISVGGAAERRTLAAS